MLTPNEDSSRLVPEGQRSRERALPDRGFNEPAEKEVVISNYFYKS
jgi:hypothetical protein